MDESYANANAPQYGETADVFKPFDEIMLADPRQRTCVRLTVDGAIHTIRLRDEYESLTGLILNSSVPKNVQVCFDTARNLCLYSWFVYRFQTVAELQGYAALDYALSLRIGREHPKAKRVRGLSRRLEFAFEQGWFRDEEIRQYKRLEKRQIELRRWLNDHESYFFPGGAPKADENNARIRDEWARRLKDSIPTFRNSMAHGEPILMGGAALTLEICCDLINQLFPETVPGQAV